MAISHFIATSSVLSATITGSTQPTTVKFILTDGSSKDGILDLAGTNTWDYKLEGDYSDGIFTVVVDESLSSQDEATIANTLVGTNCLLKRVLDGSYDCILMQELELIETLILSTEGDLAREIYTKILNRCTECVDAELASLEGISIWIINNDFIVQ